MNPNNKLIILIVLVVLTISSFIYLQTLNSNVDEKFRLYEKTSNEIAIITKLKSHYGTKKINKRKIYNIIDKYGDKTISKKENKTSLEFTISKLNYKELDTLNKEILNSGVKVIKLTINKIDANIGKLSCKVMF